MYKLIVKDMVTTNARTTLTWPHRHLPRVNHVLNRRRHLKIVWMMLRRGTKGLQMETVIGVHPAKRVDHSMKQTAKVLLENDSVFGMLELPCVERVVLHQQISANQLLPVLFLEQIPCVHRLDWTAFHALQWMAKEPTTAKASTCATTN